MFDVIYFDKVKQIPRFIKFTNVWMLGRWWKPILTHCLSNVKLFA